jgi:hypothetical protein
MRQMKVKVRPDEGQATSSSASRRPIRRFGCRHTQLRSNFLAGRLDGTENCLQQPGNLGNVGLKISLLILNGRVKGAELRTLKKSVQGTLT